MFSMAILEGHSINMKVGDARTLSITPPHYLSSCKWNISHPECIQITSAVYATSTSIDIKAIKATPPATYCLVQCVYHYKELDPTSGKYIYDRTGSEVWRILVEGNDSGGGTGGGGTGGGTTTPKLELTHTEITVEQGQWSTDIKSYLTTTPDGTCKWTIDDESIAKINRREFFRTKVVGERPGTTYLRAVSKDGATAVCKVIVTSRSYKEEEPFYGITDDEPKVNLTCFVSKDNPKTCKIYIKSPDYPYDDTPLYKVEKIPEYVAGYKVTAIDGIDKAASQTSGVSSIKIPSFITRIGSKAFAYAYNLREISIPATVKEIGAEAFRSCYDLEKAECNFNENSGTGIFQDCKALKSVVIKSGEIPNRAFENCENLKFVTINPNVTFIGWAAFQNCKSLFEIDIPSTITHIDGLAFRHCTSLSKVNLSEGIQYIDNCSFQNCNIKELVLPSTLKSIGLHAFSVENDFSYTTITSKISQPFSISSYVFNDATYQNAVLIVPASSKHLYETTPGWNKFQHIEGYGASGSDDDMVETVLYEGLNEDDATCDWTFESFDVDDDYNFIPSDKEVWRWAAYNGKHYLVGNAHEFSAPFYINSFAFSPAIRVNKLRKFRISFDHAAKYQESGLFDIASVRLYYADREDKEDDGLLCIGDIPTIPTPGTWTFVNSGEIEMNVDESKTDVSCVRICLYYHGDSEDGANAWEIRNIKMVGIGPASAIDEVIVDAPEANYPTEVYNLSGVKVADSTDNLPAGIYIVRRGPSAQKIAIR